MSEGGFDNRATHVACGAEDLRSGLSVGIGLRRDWIGSAMVYSRPILAASQGFADRVDRSWRGVAI